MRALAQVMGAMTRNDAVKLIAQATAAAMGTVE